MNLNLSKYNGKAGLVSYANKSKEKKQKKADRSIKQSFYNTAIWSRLRDQQLRESPLCIRCENMGDVVEAEVVDHVLPFIDVNDTLATDSDNLRSICKSCHSYTTIRETRDRKEWHKMYENGSSIDDIALIKYAADKYNVDSDGYYV